MRQAVMVGVVLPAALLLVSGCATKKWVTEYVGKEKGDINSGVDSKMSAESQRVDQKVDGVDTRLKTAEGTLTADDRDGQRREGHRRTAPTPRPTRRTVG